MADCRELIRLAGTLRWVFGGLALVLAGAGVLLRRHRTLADGVLAGLGTAGILFTGLVLWALADFDGFFTAFHRVAFTNDGWLLDSRTDLLIRLMPTEFFIRLGLHGLLRFAALPVILAVFAHVARKVDRDEKKVLAE